jgi:predicted nucleotidyltransferase
MARRSLEQYLSLLRQHETELRAHGIVGAAIFGSVARGDATDESDLDILVDLDPDHRLGFAYFSLPDDFERILGVKTDVVSRGAIKPPIRERVLRDAVRAF